MIILRNALVFAAIVVAAFLVLTDAQSKQKVTENVKVATAPSYRVVAATSFIVCG